MIAAIWFILECQVSVSELKLVLEILKTYGYWGLKIVRGR